jgi:hypothetical protein
MLRSSYINDTNQTSRFIYYGTPREDDSSNKEATVVAGSAAESSVIGLRDLSAGDWQIYSHLHNA